MNTTLTRIASMTLATGAAFALISYGITEEVPVGSLHGRLVMKENGQPLKDALVELTPFFSEFDEGPPVKTRFVRTKADGTFSFNNALACTYSISVATKAHRIQHTTIDLAEGKQTDIALQAEPIDPFLDLYANKHTFAPDDNIEFEARGFVKGAADKLKVVAYKLDFAKTAKTGSLYSAFSAFSSPKSDFSPEKAGTVAANWEIPITNRDYEGVFMHRVRPEALKEGLYWLAISGGKDLPVRGTWLNITKIGIVGKRAGKQGLAFVADLNTGRPIVGASVGFVAAEGLSYVAKTDSTGVARFEWLAGAKDVMVASMGESQGMVDFYEGEREAAGLRIVMYGDRPVYRPGDTFSFKGIARAVKGANLELPPNKPVALTLSDESENVLAKTSVTMTSMGTFSGSFTLSKEAEPGYYQVEAQIGESRATLPVSIAAYRKPTYSVTVQPESKAYVRGDTVRFLVEAEYYYGGPVVDAEVNAYIYSEIDWYSDELSEYFESSEGRWVSGRLTEEIATKTDSKGRAVIEVPVRSSEEGDEFDYRYFATVSVADEGGKYFDGTGSVRVARGLVNLVAETDRYVVEPNQAINLKLKATSDTEKAAGLMVEVRHGEDRWDGVGVTMLEAKTQTVTLDANGEATLSMTPKHGGSYTFKATVRDSRGNQIESSAWVYVSGDFADEGRTFPFTMRLDKPSYAAGEQAVALLQTDAPGGVALITVETDKIKWVQTVELTQKSTTVKIPVADEYAPAASVSVSYIRNREYYSGFESLKISLGERKLQVDVTPGQPTYRPGDTASFTVTTRSAAGTPVPAEISFGLVDESIYAIAEDNFQLLEELYPAISHSVQTQHSFPNLYLDGGEKAPTNVQVRRVFKDTAHWAPFVATNAAGQATVTMKLPDNLTTWRATARAITSRSEAGQATTKIVATKDLIVRIEGASYVTIGDKLSFNLVVANHTASDATVNLDLAATGITLDPAPKNIQVKAGGTEAVPIKAEPGLSGEAVVTAKAWIDGGASDGVEQRIAVRAAGITMEASAFGNTRDAPSFMLNLDASADKNAGYLRIHADSSIAGSAFQSLDYLVDFPYGCVEQTMSRFFPAIMVQKLVSDLKLPRPKRLDDMPKIVGESLVRLGNFQGQQGGWGWWENDEPDTQMTAYVLEGLLAAKSLGHPVPERMLQRGIEAGERILGTKITPALWATTQEDISNYWKSETSDRCYLAAVLMGTKAAPAARAFVKTVSLEKAGAITTAYLALCAHRDGADPTPALRRLAGLARVSGPIASWDEEYWGMETTARCANILALISPADPLVPKAIRAVLEKRRGYYWTSTRDTAHALLALSTYVRGTKEQVNFTGQASVMVNGTEVGRIDFLKGAATTPMIEVPIGGLRMGDNQISIRRNDGGMLYYSATLKSVVPNPPTPAPGLKITRTYHRMQAERRADGTMAFEPNPNPDTEFRKGDLIRVRLTIHSDRIMDYIMIEDPLPAAFRITDRDVLPSGEEWSWWWSSSSFRDDRATFFARRTEIGEQVVEYTMRAEMGGEAVANSAVAFNMYEPHLRSFSAIAELRVGD